MANCDIHDLHYNGRFYTWSNKQVSERRVMSKIDRFLGNDHWEEIFPNVVVTFLLEGIYDHSPMLVQFSLPCRGKKPFRFFSVWSNMDDFLDVIKGVWETNIQGYSRYQISQNLKILKQLLRDKCGRDQI